MTATVAEIRATIVDALQDADATEFVDAASLEAFEKGEGDVRLADLNLDSLRRMELLVALEMVYGAVVLPDVFARYESLGDLVSHVESGESGGASTFELTVGSQAGTGPSAEKEAGASLPRVARLFRRALVRCGTVAEMHLLLSQLADRMSPGEAAELQGCQRAGELIPRDAPEKFGEALTRWLDGFMGNLRGIGKAELEPFVGRRVSPAVMHYAGPGARAGKTLLICFSAKGSRSMSIALPMFLQHLDARRFDVLVLSDVLDTAFRGGVPMLGANVHEVVAWVANLELLRDYAATRTTGCSAGVYPAMLTGRAIDAELVVGLNGRFPSERHLFTLLGMYFHCWRSARRHREVPVILTHGLTRSRDVAFARRLRRLTGARDLAVEIPGRDVAHNVLPPLLEHGGLGTFLERTLLARVDSAWLARRGTSETLCLPAALSLDAEGHV